MKVDADRLNSKMGRAGQPSMMNESERADSKIKRKGRV
jgi:hypothetical protein